MEIQYRTTLTQNNVLVNGLEDTAETEFAVRMLTGAEIEGLLPCRQQILDGERSLCYEAGALRPLTEFFPGRKLEQAFMRRLLEKIAEVSARLEEYLLDTAGLLLEPGYVFADDSLETFAYLYIPGGRAEFPEAFRELAEFLLEYMDYTDRGTVLLGYGIYKRIQEGRDTVGTLLVWCRSCQEGTAGKEARTQTSAGEQPQSAKEGPMAVRGQEPGVQEMRGNSSAPLGTQGERRRGRLPARERRKISAADARTGNRRGRRKTRKYVLAVLAAVAAAILGYKRLQDFGYFAEAPEAQIVVEEGYPSPGEEPGTGGMRNIGAKAAAAAGIAAAALAGTAGVAAIRHRSSRNKKDEDTERHSGQGELTVCLYRQEESHKLVRQDNQEELPLTGESLLLGKEEGVVDHVLAEPAVSRRHARLNRRGEHWYVRDMGSTNGTWVNGRRLAAEEEALLGQGDEIELGGVRLLFL